MEWVRSLSGYQFAADSLLTRKSPGRSPATTDQPSFNSRDQPFPFTGRADAEAGASTCARMNTPLVSPETRHVPSLSSIGVVDIRRISLAASPLDPTPLRPPLATEVSRLGSGPACLLARESETSPYRSPQPPRK